MAKSPMDMMMGAPEGEMPPEEMAPEEAPMEEMAPEAPAEGVVIPLPAGFKAPDGVQDGQPFSTTVTGMISGGNFVVEEIGDMPLGGAPEVESPAEDMGELEEAPTDPRADRAAAKAAFQPSR